jgi:hypothetical protein
VAREKGYRVSGAVEYDPGPREPMPDVTIADDIIENAIEGEMELNPGQRRADVEERLTQLLTGAVDPHPLRVVRTRPPIGTSSDGGRDGIHRIVLCVYIFFYGVVPMALYYLEVALGLRRWGNGTDHQGVLYARVERLPVPDPCDGRERGERLGRRPTRPA